MVPTGGDKGQTGRSRHCAVSVAVTRIPSMRGAMIVKAPKTEARRRKVTIPSNVVPALGSHLDRFVGADPDSLVVATARRVVRCCRRCSLWCGLGHA